MNAIIHIDIESPNKLMHCLHFEQHRSGFFGPWNGLVLDWFSFPQLKLDLIPNWPNETGLVSENLNWNWIGFRKPELKLDWFWPSRTRTGLVILIFLFSFFPLFSFLPPPFSELLLFSNSHQRDVAPSIWSHHMSTTILKLGCIHMCIYRLLAPNSSACAHTVLHRFEMNVVTNLCRLTSYELLQLLVPTCHHKFL